MLLKTVTIKEVYWFTGESGVEDILDRVEWDMEESHVDFYNGKWLPLGPCMEDKAGKVDYGQVIKAWMFS